LRIVIIFGLAAMLAGCVTDAASTVLPIGPDTYRVSGSAYTSFGGYAAGEAEALKTANHYCQSQGRQMLMLSHEGTATIGSGTAYINFRCLAEGDRDLKRPTYRPTPNIVIETH
jgi:hypothetical protein